MHPDTVELYLVVLVVLGTHTGTLAGIIPPTGRVVDTPPQACSMKFNEEGLCTQLTIG